MDDKDTFNKKGTHQPFEDIPFDDEALQQVHAPNAPVARENDEPWEGNSEMPFVLFIAVVFLAFGMGAYLMRYSFNFDYFIYDHNKSLTLDISGPKEVAWDPLAQGEKIFKKNCTQCHQTTGLGVPGSYPPLVGSPWLLKDPETPVRILLMGLEGPITVKEGEFNGAMPSFGKKFNDKQIAAVLSYVRQAWGNTATPVEEPSVTKMRETLGSRSRVWSSQELAQLRQ